MKRPLPDGDRPVPDSEVVAFDVALLAFVPTGVIFFHILASSSLKSRLTHEIGASTPLSMFGHAFVHFSFEGMLWNVLGYVVLVSIGYGLAICIGERSWFVLSLAAIVATVPVAAGIIDGVVFESVAPATTISVRGLSAVVGGIAGLLFVVYLGLLRRVYDPTAVVLGGSALWIALVAAFADGYSSLPRVWVYSLPILAVVIVGIEGMRRSGWSPRRIEMEKLRAVFPSTVIVTAALLAAIVVMFPNDLHSGGTFTNVFGHAAGWTVGVVVSWWGHRYWTDVSWVR